MFGTLMLVYLLSVICSNLPTQCMQGGVIALTIDEGPTSYTNEILDIQEEVGVLATFHFNTMVRGNDVNRAYVRAVEDGHDVGFRTSPKRVYDGEEDAKEVKEDLDQQIKFLESKTDSKVKYARSPLDGAMPIDTVDDYFLKNDIVQTSYSFNPYDDGDMDPVDSLNEFLAPSYAKKDSFIIQVYEQRLGEDKSLRKMIKAIKARNYTFVKLSECLDGYKPGDDLIVSSGGSSGTSEKSFSTEVINSYQFRWIISFLAV
jgi:peptidoglycan/xylan/chitin deacetylase (PgdA/CDA1 family)